MSSDLDETVLEPDKEDRNTGFKLEKAASNKGEALKTETGYTPMTPVKDFLRGVALKIPVLEDQVHTGRYVGRKAEQMLDRELEQLNKGIETEHGSLKTSPNQDSLIITYKGDQADGFKVNGTQSTYTEMGEVKEIGPRLEGRESSLYLTKIEHPESWYRMKITDTSSMKLVASKINPADQDYSHS